MRILLLSYFGFAWENMDWETFPNLFLAESNLHYNYQDSCLFKSISLLK